MCASVLLVHTNRATLLKLTGLLAREGYDVTTATSFKEARALLASVCPDVLVTAIRLDAFNGIGLALLAHHHQPTVAVVVTDAAHDAVLEREAARVGAAYVVNPIANLGFLSSVNMALMARGDVHSTSAVFPVK